MLEGNPDAVKRYTPPRNRAGKRRSGDGDAGIGSSYIHHENANLRWVPLDGCSSSVAAEILNARWVDAVQAYNTPSAPLIEKPVMCSGATGSSWGHFKLPHQMDFLTELRRKIKEQLSADGTVVQN